MDIKQAAKWVQQHGRVRRPVLSPEISIGCHDGGDSDWLEVYEGPYRARDRRQALFTCEDLLADDWEVANEPA